MHAWASSCRSRLRYSSPRRGEEISKINQQLNLIGRRKRILRSFTLYDMNQFILYVYRSASKISKGKLTSMILAFPHLDGAISGPAGTTPGWDLVWGRMSSWTTPPPTVPARHATQRRTQRAQSRSHGRLTQSGGAAQGCASLPSLDQSDRYLCVH